MTLLPLPSRLRGSVAFWALAGLALLLSHDAIFLAQVGPGEGLSRALRTAGHGYWAIASLGLAAAGLATAVAVAVRLLRLGRRARSLDAQRPLRRAGYGARALIIWARLLVVVAIGFAIQENLEHLGHSHAIGAGALIGPEYPLALPVIGLITMVAASIAALMTGAERALIATIAAALRRVVHRAPRRLDRPPLRITEPRTSVLASAAAGRAPPRLLHSAT